MDAGQFCSDDHYLMHAVDTYTTESLYLYPDPEPAAAADNAIEFPAPPPQSFSGAICTITEIALAADLRVGLQFAGLVTMRLPMEPKRCIPAAVTPEAKVQQPAHRLPAPSLVPFTPVLQFASKRHLGWLSRFKSAPVHWKLLASLVPIILAACFDPLSSVANPDDGSKEAAVAPKLAGPIQQMKESIRQRAAVILTDDFRSGLDAWESKSNLSNAWAYDPNGFVRPGSLAVYRPSMGMTDYTLEFLTQVEERAIGAAFRVEDWDHYYVVKLIVTQQGESPTFAALHYAVINGKEAGKVMHPLPITVRNTSLYRIRLDVHGRDFTLISHGKIVDYWSDARYSKGGVGFFCGKGEKAKVRWVEVSHQYDLLGRFCAFLSPDDGTGSKSGLE
ncbi:MAG: hypothetical protein JO022_03915 [Acidobacteriaceae bacterium]|nr:hypothetical protein [Acidobacteriaceae bacterium]